MREHRSTPREQNTGVVQVYSCHCIAGRTSALPPGDRRGRRTALDPAVNGPRAPVRGLLRALRAGAAGDGLVAANVLVTVTSAPSRWNHEQKRHCPLYVRRL